MARKRYFFVHLAIFAAVCATFAIAGFSSYQDYVDDQRPEVASPSGTTAAPGERPARTGPDISVLALSAK
jgi:hypothetical protein